MNRDPRQAKFPDDDLAAILIQTFFEKCLLCSTILLQDTFEENWRSHAHLLDESTAALTLVVFAVACKFVRNEPRIAPDPTNCRQAGNEYYEEVRSFYSRIQNPISLAQFQGLAVSIVMRLCTLLKLIQHISFRLTFSIYLVFTTLLGLLLVLLCA